MRIFWVFAVLILPFTQCGCLTSARWNEATSGKIQLPRYVGTATDSAGRTRTVFEYVSPGSGFGSHRFLLPLDTSGRAIAPLTYIGPARSRDEMEQQVPAASFYAVAHVQLDRSNFTEYDEAKKAGRFHQDERFSDGVYGMDWQMWKCAGFLIDRRGRIVLTKDRYTGLPSTRPLYEQDGEYPRDVDVVLLPNSQPMPSGEQALRIVITAASTPLLLVADVFVTPAFLLAFSTTKC